MSQTVSSADFKEKVLESPVPVLVDFSATWCGPCQMLAPVIDQIGEELAGTVAVYKVDIDESPEIAGRYGVMAVPTVIVFADGQVKNKTMGVQPKEKILALLD